MSIISIDQKLLIAHADTHIDIISPWSGPSNPVRLDRVMDGDFVYVGSMLGTSCYFIDFLCLKDVTNIARWHVDYSGHYISQHRIHSATVNILREDIAQYEHVTEAVVFQSIAKKYLNDLQIYMCIKYILSNASQATAFLSGNAPVELQTSNKAGPEGRLNIVCIFNHNYMRNIPLLDHEYQHRFNNVLYVLPSVGPVHDRVVTTPYGSFQYHLAIYAAIEKITKGSEYADQWYCFVQDDVFLNRSFSQLTFNKYVGVTGSSSSAYYKPVVSDYHSTWNPSGNWLWSKRVRNRILSQRDALYGNGFEGFNTLFDEQSLAWGVGDIFFLKGEWLPHFSELLGMFIGQDIFPEVSIPSALRALSVTTQTECALFDGTYLWGVQRSETTIDKAYLENFSASDKLFLHPVKVARYQ